MDTRRIRARSVLAAAAALLVVALGMPGHSGAESKGERVGSSVAPPPSAALNEPLQDVFFGTAAIPPGLSRITVANRYITASSRVYLSVDTTSEPDGGGSMSGVEVVGKSPGVFAVRALDRQPAGAAGLPFSFVVANASTLGSTTAGTAMIKSGTSFVDVATSAATASTHYALTVDVDNLPDGELPRPGVRVTSSTSGSFRIATLTGGPMPSDTRVQWLANSDPACLIACNARIARGFNNHNQSSSSVSQPAVVLVTSRNPTLGPGIRVHTHGAGFLQAATLTLQNAAADLPFDYFVFTPLHRWEEYGPTGWTGNAWTVVVNAADTNTQYIGSLTGVWKTVNGGDTWFHAWDQPTSAIVRLAATPGVPDYVWAMALDGQTWWTQNGGQTWTKVPTVTAANGVTRSAGFVSTRRDLVYACHRSGLYKFDAAVNRWVEEAIPGAGKDCSDVIRLPDGRLAAAFRTSNVPIINGEPTGTGDGGVYLRAAAEGSAWKKVLTQIGAPMRLAANSTQLVANIDCTLARANLSDLLAAPDVVTANKKWTQLIRVSGGGVSTHSHPFDLSDASHFCGNELAGQNGYAMSVAVSPTDPDRIIALAQSGFMMTKNSAGQLRWRPNPTDDPGYRCKQTHCTLGLTGDDHEVHFVTSDYVVAAPDTSASTYSTDKGLTWHHTAHNEAVSDGPPISEFYNVTASQPDPFGRVLVGGNAQDLGGRFMLGRTTGFYCCGGESGITAAAQKLLAHTVTETIGGKTLSVRKTQLRAYGSSTDEETGIALVVQSCLYDIEGPDYALKGPNGDPTATPDDEARYPPPACVRSKPLPSPISTMATSRAGGRAVLIGLADGRIARPDPADTVETDGIDFEIVPGSTVTDTRVTAIYFASDTRAYIGHDGGAIDVVTNPFGSSTTSPKLAITPAVSPSSGTIRGFGAAYADGTGEVYMADGDQVWMARNATTTTTDSQGRLAFSWEELTGGVGTPLQANIASGGLEIVGVVRDEGSNRVYVATGRSLLVGSFGGIDGVWRRPPAGSDGAVFVGTHVAAGLKFPGWARFTEGLPTKADGKPAGMPITGLAIAANRALFLSTQGGGIWWRRDVGQAAGSGLNEPAAATVRAGRVLSLVTTCADPKGWKHIRVLELKLAQGLGAEDGSPYALWAQFDQDRGLIRLYDERHQRWLEGKPGESRTLETPLASIDLSATEIRPLTPAQPAVEIHWAIRIEKRAGGALQQYLRVNDDDGLRTTWDRVGSVTVRPPGDGGSSSTWLWWVLGGAAIVVLLAAVLLVRRRLAAEAPRREDDPAPAE